MLYYGHNKTKKSKNFLLHLNVVVLLYVCVSEEVTVQVFEYQWPLNDKSAEWFLLQEHISEFLGVVSFKRKYPGM